MDKELIEKKVSELLESINYSDDADSINVIKVAKSMGFTVGNANLKDEVDGFIIVDPTADRIFGEKTNKLIAVNSTRELEWKRFIIAHEIAHYKLHYKDENDIELFAHREHKKGKDAIENDADYFAAALLLPKEKFIAKFNELKEKGLSIEEVVVLLANKFLVTKPTVRRRIMELKLNEG